jgi:hypothetical protein
VVVVAVAVVLAQVVPVTQAAQALSLLAINQHLRKQSVEL